MRTKRILILQFFTLFSSFSSLSGAYSPSTFYIGSKYINQDGKLLTRKDYTTHVRRALAQLGMIEVPTVQEADFIWDLQWTNLTDFKDIGLKKPQIINMLPGAAKEVFGDKDCLHNLIQEARLNYKQDTLDRTFPQSFILNNQSGSNLSQFIQGIENDNQQNFWILKKLESWSGKGVSVHSSADLLQMAQDISDETFVVQRYVHNILLLDGFKFDMRWWVLVTSLEPLKAYIYRNSYVRSSNYKYSFEQNALDAKCIHITNGEVQKKCENNCRNGFRDRNSTRRREFRNICKPIKFLMNNKFPNHLKDPMFYNLLRDVDDIRYLTNFEEIYEAVEESIKQSLLIAIQRLKLLKNQYTTASTVQLLSYDIILESSRQKFNALIEEINTNGYLGKGILQVVPDKSPGFLETMFKLVFRDIESSETESCSTSESSDNFKKLSVFWKSLF